MFGREAIKKYWLFIIIILITAFLRFYKISYPFSVNGIDEGVQLMAGRMYSQGYAMYTQINSVQAPLFLWIYSLIGGDIILARVISAVFSIFGTIGVILIAYKLKNKRTALYAGIFTSFNYYFIKEGRLASLDLFCTVLLIWAFYFMILFLKNYILKRNLVFSGILFSLASMTKLFAVIPLIGVALYLLLWCFIGYRKDKKKYRKILFSLIIFAITIIITTLVIISIFGIEETFRGCFLNNLNRPHQKFWDKVSPFLDFLFYFSFPIFLSIIVIKKYRKTKELQILLCWIFPLLLFFIFQPITWSHYFTLLIPPFAILGALGLENLLSENSYKLKKKNYDKKKIALFSITFIFILSQIFYGFFVVLTVEKPIEALVAYDVKKLTTKDDFVISGDPTIALYADRNQVPETTNLAKVKFTPLLSQKLINLTEKYKVKVVVFTYNLTNSQKYVTYIKNNFEFYKAYDNNGNCSIIEGKIKISQQNFNIYIRKT